MTTIDDALDGGFLELALMKGESMVEAKVVGPDGEHLAVHVGADELRAVVAGLASHGGPDARVGDIVRFRLPGGGTVSDPRWWDTIQEVEWTVIRAGGAHDGWSPWLQLRDRATGRTIGAFPQSVEVIGHEGDTVC